MIVLKYLAQSQLFALVQNVTLIFLIFCFGFFHFEQSFNAANVSVQVILHVSFVKHQVQLVWFSFDAEQKGLHEMMLPFLVIDLQKIVKPRYGYFLVYLKGNLTKMSSHFLRQRRARIATQTLFHLGLQFNTELKGLL